MVKCLLFCAMSNELDEHFFMATAFLVAKKSRSPEPVGAVIVNGAKQIVGIGYNMDGCHAEIVAMYKSSQPLEDCTLYLTLHPCIACSETIRDSGIRKVYYNYSKYNTSHYAEYNDCGNAEIEYIKYVKQNNWFINFTNLLREPESSNSDGISWDHLFMGIAYLISEVKRCQSQVGAIIVNDRNQIVSIGYKTNAGATHAEINAIFNNAPDPDYSSIENCTLYISVFPCNNCAIAIKEEGIIRVVYNYDWLPNIPKILSQMGIECVSYSPPNDLIVNYFIPYPRH